MPKQPIYEYMMDSLVDGTLPPDFSLASYEGQADQVLFADGALDGITIYHTARPELPASLQETFAWGISQACDEDYEAANETFSAIAGEYRAIVIIDELQRYVLEHNADIDAQRLWAYTTFLLFFSTDKELVKMGLSLLELFGEPQENVKSIVRLLALSDEFTIFAAWCARGWQDGNEELFRLAKNVEGWGRIHVVEMLEPATDEIRGWLLREGAHNDVMPEYSALTCYEKAGVSQLLVGDMSHEEFCAASFIVQAALSDQPVAGLSVLDDPKAELERYVAQAARQQLNAQDRECVGAISEYASERGWDDLASSCKALLDA